MQEVDHAVMVSVCMPVYNNLSQCQRALASLLRQTYQDYEIIISDDSTNKEIEEYVHAQGLGQVCYIHNERPLGHVHNWNHAMNFARGKYIKILFSDDWLTGDESLQEWVAMLEANPQADLAFSGSRQVSEEGVRDREASLQYVERLRKDYRTLFMGNEIGAPSATLIRNRGYQFDASSNWASDVFLYFEILARNPEFVYTSKPLITIYEHPEQYTNSFALYDPRKYGDYELLYRNYNLGDEQRYAEYFAMNYLIPYRKGFSSARKCGYSFGQYGKYWWRYRAKVLFPAYRKRILRIFRR